MRVSGSPRPIISFWRTEFRESFKNSIASPERLLLAVVVVRLLLLGLLREHALVFAHYGRVVVCGKVIG